MSQVQLIWGGEIKNGREGSTARKVYRITGVNIGDGPTTELGIPQRGASISLGGRTLYFASATATPWNDNDFQIVVDYGTQSLRSYSIDYKKVAVPLPIFVRGLRPYQGGSTIVWDPVERSLELNWMVLNSSVTIRGLTDPQIRAEISNIAAQVGHIHILSGFGGRLWRMNAPQISRASELVSDAVFSYTWESDPGNGPIQAPDETPENPFPALTPPARPPFQDYLPLPSRTFSGQPRIALFNPYPTSSPFYTPNGWVGLPGAPI